MAARRHLLRGPRADPRRRPRSQRSQRIYRARGRPNLMLASSKVWHFITAAKEQVTITTIENRHADLLVRCEAVSERKKKAPVSLSRQIRTQPMKGAPAFGKIRRSSWHVPSASTLLQNSRLELYLDHVVLSRT